MFNSRALINASGKRLGQQLIMNMRPISTTSMRPFFRDPFFRDPFALTFFDPSRPTRQMMRRARPLVSEMMDPFVALDHFFDDKYVPQIRENAGKLDVDESGNLTYTVDTLGYSPDELKVNIEGDELVVQGEHKKESEGETVHRQFVRRVRIPEGFLTESVKCELGEKGRLCLTVPKKDAEPAKERRSIPIDVKPPKADEK